MSFSKNKKELKIELCSKKAAQYACRWWHYATTFPVGKLVTFGVWEGGEFIGVVIYGRGASPDIGTPFGVSQSHVCELVRVALKLHVNPVSKIVAFTLRRLKKINPGLKLVVSYADMEQDHYGIIYQAMNWVYWGEVKFLGDCFYKGKWRHNRFAIKLGIFNQLPRRKRKVKHKYVYPLEPSLRAMLLERVKEFPIKNCAVEA